jgi:hypothetical protein
MSDEDLPPTEAELREAEVLRRALEQRRAGEWLDVSPIDDALGAALLLRSIGQGGLSELRMRAVHARVIRSKASRAPLIASAGIAAAIALLIFVGPEQKHRSAAAIALPPPSQALLRAQLQAAQPNGDLALLDAQLAAHRARIFAALPEGARRPR